MNASVRFLRNRTATLMVLGLLIFVNCGTATPSGGNHPSADPYAAYVWPAPPDAPRIKLSNIFRGRLDIEANSRFSAVLMGAAPNSVYDWMKRPFGVAFDSEGRILVTDSRLGALFRFDRSARRMDVFGTKGPIRLKSPHGLTTATDGLIYVADGGIGRVVAFDPSGSVVASYGRSGELANPTDVAISPDGKQLFVADSMGHKIVVFEIGKSEKQSEFGRQGTGEGEFNFPTSLAFTAEGELCVVDQVNARVQVFTATGEFVFQFGQRGVDFGNFVRPKDIAFDDDGLVYVTDGAFSNVQIFSPDLRLLTFVGEGGTGPGQFQGAAGVATRGDEFAIVDTNGRRVEVFQYVGEKNW